MILATSVIASRSAEERRHASTSVRPAPAGVKARTHTRCVPFSTPRASDGSSVTLAPVPTICTSVARLVAQTLISLAPADLPVFVASVYRTEGRRDFSPVAIARLESIHPFIDNAVSRLHERAAAKSAWDSLAPTVRDRAFGFAVLDSNLCLVEANGRSSSVCGVG